MSSFYWLSPDWVKAECPECGRNIWDSGGDPDWGLCFGCFNRKLEGEQREREMYKEQEENFLSQMEGE